MHKNMLQIFRLPNTKFDTLFKSKIMGDMNGILIAISNKNLTLIYWSNKSVGS